MDRRLLGGLSRCGNRVRDRIRLLLLLAACVALAAEIPAQTSSETHALLVGCTRYPHLPERFSLEGPANDVSLTRELLTNRFGLEEANITTLVGWPDDPQTRPTRANIERELKRLTETVRSGDQVMILLGGHGSQAPNDDEGGDLEPDGFDELFLPADVRGWSGSKGEVENAIRDDEIKTWLAELRRRGAFVWIIFDSCHSGTMTRGAPAATARERRVPAADLVPEDVLAAAARRASALGTTRGGRAVEEDVLDLSPSAGGLVAMYAAQPHELTPEMPLPTRDAPRYGLFTYTLNRILRQASSPLTYRELVERVSTHYRGMGRSSPTPLIEGGGIDHHVLSQTALPGPPSMLVSGTSEDGYTIDAGSLRGLTPGTILSVYPPAGAPDGAQPIGHLRLERVQALSSIAAPVAFDGLAAPEDSRLVENSRCRVAFLDYGDLRLRLAVQTQAEAESETPRSWPRGKAPEPLETALAAMESQGARLVERVPSARDADWIVRVVEDRVLLVPASGWSRDGRDDLAPESFSLGELGSPALRSRLPDALRTIAKAIHLLRLATMEGPTSNDDVDVQIELLRLRDGSPSGEPVPYGPQGRTLAVGDQVVFRLTNPTSQPIDVSLLFIDSSYGIHAVPGLQTAVDNRLGPGRSIKSKKLRITSETLGPEHVIAIAVRTPTLGPVLDFASFLTQPSLEQTRGPAAAAASSPLGRLLQKAAFGAGTVRGLAPAALESYAVKLLDWRTVPR